MEERQWIQAIQNGNKEYLQDIAEKYYDDIYRFCAFQAGNREDAYDLAQETFLRFIRYVESYRQRNLKGYLLTIAMNVCRNYLARKGRENRMTVSYGEEQIQNICSDERIPGNIPDTGPGGKAFTDPRGDTERGSGRVPAAPWEVSEPERRAVEKDVQSRLAEALARLPEFQREAILLHYLYDMKYREISRITKVSVSTAKSRVRQGMEKLQDILRKEDFFD